MIRVLVFLFLLVSSSVQAEELSIHVEWGYTPPTSPAVTGFVLYQDSVKACNFVGADIIESDCTVDIVKIKTPFTLTASFADNTESPHSAPYEFVVQIPGPVILSITTNE
jgi:hypothetical protein